MIEDQWRWVRAGVVGKARNSDSLAATGQSGGVSRTPEHVRPERVHGSPADIESHQAEGRSHQRTITVLVGIATGLAVAVRAALVGNPVRTLWAEDGAVFLQDATRRPLASLASSYSGYGLLLPRVLGELGNFVPIERWPTLVLITAAVVVGLTSVVVVRAAYALDLGVPACVVAGMIPAMLPGLGQEVLGAWANLQWVLPYGLAWILLVPPARSGRVVPAVFGLVAIGSGAAAVFVCPLLLVHGRRWYRHPAVPGLAIGALYQLCVLLSPSVSIPNPDQRKPGVTSTIARELITEPARALVDSGGGLLTNRLLPYGAVLLILAIVIAVAFSPQPRSGLALIACAYASLVVMSVLNGSVAYRYASLAASLILAALIVTLGARDSSRPWFACALVILCVPWALSLPISPLRASGPTWSVSVERARTICRNEGATRSTIVRLPVSPSHWGAASLPCLIVE